MSCYVKTPGGHDVDVEVVPADVLMPAGTPEEQGRQNAVLALFDAGFDAGRTAGFETARDRAIELIESLDP